MTFRTIGINIWDDYNQDVDNIEDTYLFIEESHIGNSNQRNILELILENINNTKQFEDVKFDLVFYDSSLKYPNLIGTENENILFKRWQINISNLLRDRREDLINTLNTLCLFYGKFPLRFYSES